MVDTRGGRGGDTGAPEPRIEPGLPELMLTMAAFVLLGAPLLFFVWRFLNQALAGRVLEGRVLTAVLGLAGLGLLLWLLARRIGRWEGR